MPFPISEKSIRLFLLDSHRLNRTMQSKNIKWINTARALCMISVYLLHSEFYYGDAGFSYGYALTPFYVNAFFLSAVICFSKNT